MPGATRSQADLSAPTAAAGAQGRPPKPATPAASGPASASPARIRTICGRPARIGTAAIVSHKKPVRLPVFVSVDPNFSMSVTPIN